MMRVFLLASVLTTQSALRQYSSQKSIISKAFGRYIYNTQTSIFSRCTISVAGKRMQLEDDVICDTGHLELVHECMKSKTNRPTNLIGRCKNVERPI